MTMEETQSREAHPSLPAGARKRQPAVNQWPMESRTPSVGHLHHLKRAAERCQTRRSGMSIHRWSEDVILVDLP